VLVGKRIAERRFLIEVAVFGAIVVLLTGGTGYRVASAILETVTNVRVKLDKPLYSFPLEITGWRGEDIPIPVNVQNIAGADDYISRLYVNQNSKMWVNLYVAYTARPRTMLGHRPQICYQASGWIHDYTERIKVDTSIGRHLPCLLHHFHRSEEEYQERVVLNYYLVNGRLTDDESVFSGVGWRTPNIAGNPARYVAQIQISSVLENSVRRAAEDMSDLLVKFFPEENGKTPAAGKIGGPVQLDK